MGEKVRFQTCLSRRNLHLASHFFSGGLDGRHSAQEWYQRNMLRKHVKNGRTSSSPSRRGIGQVFPRSCSSEHERLDPAILAALLQSAWVFGLSLIGNVLVGE